MRSRYCAYVIDNREYLAETWHPDFRSIDLASNPLIRWIGLEIIASDEQAGQATVEFEARLLLADRVETMHELSSFVRDNGQWLYTEGKMMAPGFPPWKPGRNELCPCNSGQKFKRCCAGH